jgi:hypothetical protein
MRAVEALAGVAASIATVTVAEIVAREVYKYRWYKQYGSYPPLTPYFLGADGKKYIRHFTAPENWVLWGAGIGLTGLGAWKNIMPAYVAGVGVTTTSFWKWMAAPE